MLSAAELSELKQALERQLAELEALEEATRDSRRPLEFDQQSVGRLSRFEAIQQQAMALATEQRRRAGVQRIRGALARMESGDYGYCLRCEEEIPPARLRADPATTLCVSCMRGDEER